ncbi:MAG TPA: helix-turn-helix transcriptional regulator [Terriglobales bacterium]|nr:helix-turn-helix transcriptional regulator [Terriglobales bacterium]
MPRKSTLQLPPLDLGNESLGQRLLRLRKVRGFSQAGLAAKIGIIQSLASDYGTDHLRLAAKTAVRFALAPNLTMDELLRPKAKRTVVKPPRLKVMRRLEGVEKLPPRKQAFILSAPDPVLRGAAGSR